MAGGACIVCGGALAPAVAEPRSSYAAIGAYRIDECRSCGIGATMPRPTAEQLDACYQASHSYATHYDLAELLSAGMSLVGVMRLLGHRDHRMTLRYAAVTPEIVAEEYRNALAKLSTKYRLPPNSAPAQPGSGDGHAPEQLLDHLARWIRKHAASSGPPRDLLRRIERLRRDVQNLATATKN